MKLGQKGEALIRSPAFAMLLLFLVGFLSGGYVLGFAVLQEEPSTWDKVKEAIQNNLLLITVVCIILITVGVGLYSWGLRRRFVR